MIEETRWSPDTCDCKMIFRVDHSKTPDGGEPIIEFVKFDKICDVHSKINNEKKRWDEVNKENKMKNYTLCEIIDQFPEFSQVVVKPDGSQIKTLKEGVQYQWAFDKDRNLKVRLSGSNIDVAKKTDINVKLKNKYGSKSEILLDNENLQTEQLVFV